MSDKTPMRCMRCGTCCLADLSCYVKEEDRERWIREDREDILHILENESAVWAGDHLVSARGGRHLRCCPFLRWDEKECTCTIYETRPRACREYRPGSSELCPQFGK